MARLDVAPKPGTGDCTIGDGSATVIDGIQLARFLARLEPAFAKGQPKARPYGPVVILTGLCRFDTGIHTCRN